MVVHRVVGLAAAVTSLGAPQSASTPLHVRVDGDWFDLAGFQHPGGMEVLRRHAGKDVAPLFYSNHRRPQTSILERYKLTSHEANDGASASLDSRYQLTNAHAADDGASDASLDLHSALYRELKAEVFAHLEERGVEWRHTFHWRPYALRLLCLIGAHGALHTAGSGQSAEVLGLGLGQNADVLGWGLAALYGLVTGRMTWTHAHNAVHNPHAVPAALRLVMRCDFVGVVAARRAEPSIAFH